MEYAYGEPTADLIAECEHLVIVRRDFDEIRRTAAEHYPVIETETLCGYTYTIVESDREACELAMRLSEEGVRAMAFVEGDPMGIEEPTE